MAKINAHGARRIGPTFFTRRVRPAGAYDVESVYYEAFRLRSDDMVQTRIMRTIPLALEEGRESVGRETRHGSSFRNLGRIVHVGSDPSIERLRSWLEGRGYEIIEESYR